MHFTQWYSVLQNTIITAKKESITNTIATTYDDLVSVILAYRNEAVAKALLGKIYAQ